MKSLNSNEMLWLDEVVELENRVEYGCYSFDWKFCLTVCFNFCFKLF